MSMEAFLKVFAAFGLSTWAVQIVIHLSKSGAENRKIAWRLIISLFTIIVLSIIGIILYHRGPDWFVKAWPTILAVVVAITYNGWFIYFSLVVSKINSRIDSIIDRSNASIVRLPDDFKRGTKPQSDVTINQIRLHLVSTSSADQQRSIARTYLGQFPTWTLMLYSWESVGNGDLEVSLGIINDVKPSIFVTIPEHESAHIKCLPRFAILTVNGRIKEICISSRDVKIDDASLTVFNNHANGS